MIAKKFGFGFGTAVLLPMLVYYGVNTLTPNPQRNDYWVKDYYARSQEATSEEKEALEAEKLRLDEEFNLRKKTFEERLFFVGTPVGIIAITVGTLLSVQAIGAGLMFGGIFTLTNSYIWYWSQLENWMRFVSLLAAFTLIVFVGYFKLRPQEERV